MVNDYEGESLYCSRIVGLELLPLPYLVGVSLCSHGVIHIEVDIKGFLFKLITQTYLTYQRGPLGLL